MLFLKDGQKQWMLWKESFILQTITVIMVFNACPGSHSKTIYSSKLSRNKMKAMKKALQKRNNCQLIKTKYFSSYYSFNDRNFQLSADCTLRISEPLLFAPLKSILVLSLIMALWASRWAVNMRNKFYSYSFTFCSYIY